METEMAGLLQRIDKLEETVENLQLSQQRLAVISNVNPKYPYWYELVANQITEHERLDLEFALSVLSDRLARVRVMIVDHHNLSEEQIIHSEDTLVSRRKAENFPEDLFVNEEPTLENTQKILLSVVKSADEYTVNKLLIGMRSQGMFKNLLQHLFPDKDETK